MVLSGSLPPDPSENQRNSRSRDSQPREKNPGADRSHGGLQSLVQAEKLVQIAFVLPCAMVICWGAGWWVEHHLGLHGATIGGLIFGLLAGMVSVIRMALGAGNSPKDRGTK